MRDLGRGRSLNSLNINPSNILFTYTDKDGYEEQRYILWVCKFHGEK